MIALLKTLHIIGLSIWMAGLIALPVIMQVYGRRAEMQTQPGFDEFRWLTHYAYTRAVTPAAIIAIAAGTVLIFAHHVLAPWMLAKLAAVSGMVLLHAWLGHVIVQAGEQRGSYRMPPVGLALLPAFGLIALVLWLVLAKPDLDTLVLALPDILREPRGNAIPARFDPL
ncbi:MAG: hypothetical protein EA339_11240 [Rhodobacteraceae bacterium]|nr:MAG: hypothetical protein EA339_11240 [Paracoccaceae bacterium]